MKNQENEDRITILYYLALVVTFLLFIGIAVISVSYVYDRQRYE